MGEMRLQIKRAWELLPVIARTLGRSESPPQNDWQADECKGAHTRRLHPTDSHLRAVYARNKCFAGRFVIYCLGGFARGQVYLKSNSLPKNPSTVFLETRVAGAFRPWTGQGARESQGRDAPATLD